jgi:hypothetical protein
VSAVPAQAPNTPAATIKSHTVTNPAEGITIHVPKSARYAGGDRFTLFGNSDCELHVFVETDLQKHVRRLYWIQFEQYLPSKPDARSNYSRDQRATLWGSPAWIAASFGRTEQTRAGSDREHMRAVLAAAGYALPPTMMQVRMVRLLDDPKGTGYGRRELMLIYAEDLALSGESFEALGGEGADTALWKQIEPALINRAAARFRVTDR